MVVDYQTFDITGPYYDLGHAQGLRTEPFVVPAWWPEPPPLSFARECEAQIAELHSPLLEELRGQGRRLFIATSKPTVFAAEIARHFGFNQHFERIYGSELDGTRTDKRELIGYLVESEALDPARTLMIGDRKHDLIGARHNGLACAAVGYGFGSREELLAEAPDWHFESLDALRSAFLGSQAA